MYAHRSLEFIHEDIIFNLDLPISEDNKVFIGGGYPNEGHALG